MPSEYLEAFSADELEDVQSLMAAQVITMAGRKLEEADWTAVYCEAKDIPYAGWSNLDIDVVGNDGLGVEHKMMGTGNSSPISKCGTRPMHPAMTRQIRIPDSDDADEVMAVVLGQYADLVRRRGRWVEEQTGSEPDLRLGWLLWKGDLSEFVYFEERMSAPDSNDYYAVWKERPSTNRRQGSRNVWVYERDTDVKRYSITNQAGAKIQPYFDVPPVDHPALYHIQVDGENVDGGVRLWVTDATKRLLARLTDIEDEDAVSAFIMSSVSAIDFSELDAAPPAVPAVPLRVSIEAYEALASSIAGATSDERLQQLVAAVNARGD